MAPPSINISCCCPLLSTKDRGKIRETRGLHFALPFSLIGRFPCLGTCFENPFCPTAPKTHFVNLTQSGKSVMPFIHETVKKNRCFPTSACDQLINSSTAHWEFKKYSSRTLILTQNRKQTKGRKLTRLHEIWRNYSYFSSLLPQRETCSEHQR